MARDTELATRLSLLEHIVGARRRDAGSPTLDGLKHSLLIGRLAGELRPLVGSASPSDQARAHLLSLRLYVLLQLDGCIETSETRLAGLLDWIATTETEQDHEFWAAFCGEGTA